MKTISFSSIKGGTGKSSLCILTANHAASAGYSVLVADLDLQNSATSYYLDSPDQADRKNIAVALHTEHIAENIIPSNYSGIDILASSLDLVKLRAIGERTLARILSVSDLPYDFLFVDTPPTYDNIVLNAVNASDLIITPVAFSQFDFKGALFYEAQLKRDTNKLPPGTSSSTTTGPRAPTIPTPSEINMRLSSAMPSATPSCPSLSRIRRSSVVRSTRASGYRRQPPKLHSMLRLQPLPPTAASNTTPRGFSHGQAQHENQAREGRS